MGVLHAGIIVNLHAAKSPSFQSIVMARLSIALKETPAMKMPLGIATINRQETKLWKRKNATLIMFNIDQDDTPEDYKFIVRYIDASISEKDLKKKSDIIPDQFFTNFAVDLQRFNDFFNTPMKFGCAAIGIGYSRMRLKGSFATYFRVTLHDIFIMIGGELESLESGKLNLVEYKSQLYIKFCPTEDPGDNAVLMHFTDTYCGFQELKIDAGAITILLEEPSLVDGVQAFNRLCYGCGCTQKDIKWCAGCMRVCFCSKECQMKMLSHHRGACRIVKSGH